MRGNTREAVVGGVALIVLAWVLVFSYAGRKTTVGGL